MSSSVRHGARRTFSTARAAANRHGRRTHIGVAVAAGTAASLAYAFSTTTLHADAKQEVLGQGQLDYSQHAQVSMFWESPGCYMWGSNRKGVADPSSADSFTKTATRIAAFDGMALRDMKVSEDMGVAVLDNGDVCQWGHSYHGPPQKRKKGVPVEPLNPTTTLRGKDISKVELGVSSIYCLSKAGEVYVLPYSGELQRTGPKIIRSATAKGDRIVDIAAGLDHIILLTKGGDIFAATTNPNGNAKGQLGLATYVHSQSDHIIDSQPVTGFKKSSKSIAIAAGDHHSVVLDEDGEVFTFGSNAHGQLAFDFNATETPDVSTPTMVAVAGLYPRNYAVRCLKIAAGGKNTYMVIENQQYGKPNPSVDIWAAGMGQFGQLGNNTWNHYQSKPVRVRVISGLSEWDEERHRVSPIGVHTLSVGGTHTVCCLDNYSKVDAEAAATRSALHDVNYGRDVFVWGGNDCFQVGADGKRNNRPTPEYISPMERSATELAVRSGWEEEGHKRFQLTPAKVIDVRTSAGGRARRNVEQAIVAGDRVSACYARLVE